MIRWLLLCPLDAGAREHSDDNAVTARLAGTRYNKKIACSHNIEAEGEFMGSRMQFKFEVDRRVYARRKAQKRTNHPEDSGICEDSYQLVAANTKVEDAITAAKVYTT